MKGRASNALFLLLIVTHPLWLISLLVDWESLIGPGTFALNATAIGWVVDAVVLAGTAQRFSRPWPQLEGPVEAVSHQSDLAGFTLRTRATAVRLFLQRAVLGTLLSTGGMAVYAFAWAALYGPAGFPWTVFALVNTVAHAVFTAGIMGIVALARYRQQEPVTYQLEGRVLRSPRGTLALSGPPSFTPIDEGMRVTSESGSLDVEAPDPVLRWMRAQLLALEDRGTREEVPSMLAAVEAAARTETR